MFERFCVPTRCFVPGCSSLRTYVFTRRSQSDHRKIINMAKADAVEVDFTGGERSATRFANSTITANMVQFDRQVSVTVYKGNKVGSAQHAAVRRCVAEGDGGRGQAAAEKARENPDMLPLIEGPQDYIPVDAALPAA